MPRRCWLNWLTMKKANGPQIVARLHVVSGDVVNRNESVRASNSRMTLYTKKHDGLFGTTNPCGPINKRHLRALPRQVGCKDRMYSSSFCNL